MHKYSIILSSRFKKSYEKAVKRGLDEEKFTRVLILLKSGEELPPKYRDHKLKKSKEYVEARECHISPDWLLIYRKQEDELILTLIDTGTHSDLF